LKEGFFGDTLLPAPQAECPGRGLPPSALLPIFITLQPELISSIFVVGVGFAACGGKAHTHHITLANCQRQ